MKITVSVVLCLFIVFIAGCTPPEPKAHVVHLPEFGQYSETLPDAPPGSYSRVFIADKNYDIADIARSFNVSVQELVRLNNLRSNRVKEGDAIYIPRGKITYPAAGPEIKAEADFIWPIKGEILTRFGDDLGGFTAQYITIRTAHGAPVRAAKSGIVNQAYQGNARGEPGLRGFESYGNFIMIAHGQGEYSMYGHLLRVLKAPGQRVRQGDIIGNAGSSGRRTKSPALRFQIFRGEKGSPVDPLKLLP